MSTETITPVSDTLQELQKNVQRIELESEGVFTVDQYTCESVGSFFKDIAHSISGWFVKKDEFLGDLRPNATTMELLDRLNTRQLENTVLPTPIGYKGLVKEYLKVLTAQRMALIDNFEENVISPLEQLLGIYVNRPSLLAEMRLAEVTRKFNFVDLTKQHAERNKFRNNKNTDAALFLSLYVSTADYQKAGEELNSLVSSTSDKQLESLRKRLEAVEEQINVLIEYISAKDNPYKLTGKVAQELSKLVLTVAEQAEAFAVLRHHIYEAGAAYKHSFVAIAKQA